MKRHLLIAIASSVIMVLSVVAGVVLALSDGWKTGLLVGVIGCAAGMLIGLVFGGLNMVRVMRDPDKMFDMFGDVK